jgi:U3 small nucleolar RNA-associated protein 4
MLVHRIRNIEYQPHAITALAFTPPSTLKEGVCHLACARENGNIEIWNPLQRFYQDRIIPGSKGASIESIVWVHDGESEGTQKPRLFSAGLDGLVCEWDLESLLPKVCAILSYIPSILSMFTVALFGAWPRTRMASSSLLVVKTDV